MARTEGIMIDIKPVTSPWPLRKIEENGRDEKKREHKKREPKKTDPVHGEAKDHRIDEYA